MPTAITLRNVTNFEIPEGVTPIEIADVPLGSIQADTTYIIERQSYSVYNCTFSKDYSDNISVFIPELDAMKELTSYKKKYTFKVYYNAHQNLLFSDANALITKNFLKALSNTDGITIEYSLPNFDFRSIALLFIQTKGIGFNSDDEGVSTKDVYGTEVNLNVEAQTALDQNDSTKVLGTLEVLNHPYTVLFTQTGSIVCYNKIDNTRNGQPIANPMLEFTINLLHSIGYI